MKFRYIESIWNVNPAQSLFFGLECCEDASVDLLCIHVLCIVLGVVMSVRQSVHRCPTRCRRAVGHRIICVGYGKKGLTCHFGGIDGLGRVGTRSMAEFGDDGAAEPGMDPGTRLPSQQGM